MRPPNSCVEPRPAEDVLSRSSNLRLKRCVLRFRDAAALLLTPARCRTCSLPLLRADVYPVCEECLASLAPPELSLCWLCGDALAVDEERAARLVHRESLRCAACALDEPPYSRAIAFGSYRGTLRNLVHLYKFEGVRSLAAPLAERLAHSIANLLTQGTTGDAARRSFTVVAVPLFRGKRSFNQSELLADEALRTLRLTHPRLQLETAHGLLKRIRPTESQSHLTPHQRRKNVRNAFECAAGVRGRHVLLVDDVLTTGATASECATELLRAGAASVNVVTLARAHRRDAVASQPSAFGYAWATWGDADSGKTATGFKSEEKR